MLLFKTIKQIFLTISMHISPKIYFSECSILLKEHYTIKLLASAPRVTNLVIYWQLVSVSNLIFPGSYNHNNFICDAWWIFYFDFPREFELFRCAFICRWIQGCQGFVCEKRHPKKNKSKRLKNNSKHFQRTFP